MKCLPKITLPTSIIIAVVSSATLAAIPPQPKAGQPLQGLTANQSLLFQKGKESYSAPLTVAQGLGPAFNQPSCVACHESPVGGWGATSVTHFGNSVGGTFDFLSSLGGPIMQQQAISPSCREFLPSSSVANHVRTRVTPSVLAFGLVEAIADASIVALEDPSDSNGDGISGRAHRVQPLESPAGPLRIGRFGWKAQIATVISFSGDAARTEMGLTNSVVSQETAPNGDAALLAQCDTVPEIEDQPDIFGKTFVDRVTAFQRYLGPPPQSPRSGMTGEAVFTEIGCSKCHTAQFTTPNDTTLESAIRGKTIRVYGDFLLHDMGALADGIPDGQALASEMKTPPLWNLRTRPALLHDGTASQGVFATRVTTAINAHAGEASTSRNAFLALPTTSKDQLIAFLNSLGRNDYDIDSDGLITASDYSLAITNFSDLNVTPDEAWAAADLNQNARIDADEIEQLRGILGFPSDCNQNGILDWVEISSGTCADLNQNGKPDECDVVCTMRAIRVTGTGGAIPDSPAAALVRTISIPQSATIQSVRVTLNINHTWLQDLDIKLMLAGNTVQLHANCGSFNDINGTYILTDSAWDGAPATLTQICDGVLIDQGGTNQETRFRYTAGTYKPTQASGFQVIRGQQMSGTWTLSIKDNRANDVGTLTNWSVEVRYTDPNPIDCDGIGGVDCQQILTTPSVDCDANGVIDTCEFSDCDGNGTNDRCQLANGTAWDCNANGILDSCDLIAGIARDCDGNGTIDSCDIAGGEPDIDNDTVLDRCEQLYGDFNLDGFVDGFDLAVVLAAWGTSDPIADLDGNGIVGGSDLLVILAHRGATPWSLPTIATVRPNAGSTTGGTAITITGTNFTGATGVTVGGTAATSVVVVSATSITAVTPAGTAGAKSVVVTTLHGSATATNSFSYIAQPTISTVSPSSGSTVGGTAITISGTNLTGATSVTVGGAAATSVVVVSATSITAVTPAGTAGAKDVVVIAPGGVATATNAFTYIGPPSISFVSPSSGPTEGNTLITITGSNFTGLTGVTVGGQPVNSVVSVSATSISAVTPAGMLGAADVVVNTLGGTVTAVGAFTYTHWYTVLEQLPDAAVVTNVAMRKAIALTGLPWRVRDIGTNIEMLLIPPGSFTMGCSPSLQSGCFSDENPTHAVTLTNAFYLGRYEVTQAQWQAKMGSNPSYFQGRIDPDPAVRPVEQVSWNMIASFNAATGMRLPTEAEWEYAYRAQSGTTVTRTAFHNGTNDAALLGNIGWYTGNNGDPGSSGYGTKVVGGQQANALGLHDMSGNVWEWCADIYSSTYYTSDPITNPTGPSSGITHVLRGGSWNVVSNYCRASVRDFRSPSLASHTRGFRSARTP